MDIRTGYTGRTLFMTGGTGFVGKVTLFKILKEFPDIKCVYLLCRGKHSRKFKRFLKPQERLELEVLGSPCFDPIRAAIGDAAWAVLKAKVRAMNGDITEDHLGLSERDRATVAAEVNLVIHLAATVNFNERLDLAIQMNTLGGLRALALAKTCRDLESMVHVSTCYVNYRRQGKDTVNEEKIYPMNFDAEGMCKTLLNLHPREVESHGNKLLKELGFPNTYTFTKNMGEQLILKYKENVPLAIVRPSIVACSYYEPMPGWVDALTAAGGLILTATLGVVREFHCRPEMTADVIPVDFVVNVILKALFRTQQLQKALHGGNTQSGTGAGPVALSSDHGNSSLVATSANMPVPTVHLAAATTSGKGVTATSTATGAPVAAAAAVARAASAGMMHPDVMIPAAELTSDELAAANSDTCVPLVIYQASTTGTANRTTWLRLMHAMSDYMQTSKKRHPKSLAKFDLTLTTSRAVYLLRYNLLRYAPYLALKALAQVPEPVGIASKSKQIGMLGKAIKRSYWLNSEFHDFVMTEWFFSCANTVNLDDGLDARSRAALRFDPYAINWWAYTQLYAWGIFKYIIRETGDFQCPTMPPSATDVFEKVSKL